MRRYPAGDIQLANGPRAVALPGAEFAMRRVGPNIGANPMEETP